MLNTNLKRLREEKGITQSDLGNAAKTTAKTVMNWESGKTEPKASELIALSKKLGVSINELLGRKETEQSKLIEKISNAIEGLDKEEIQSLMIMVEALYLRNQSHKANDIFSRTDAS
ncbi:helix-turn-helix domain-containing protein [Photobacterium leiognathi subsp. mandapamensis]|uniref:helix-turn-helix domain-containing protein n=1 Tax=Photobacterium leiognathi TaxID=553611 RepID=UPI003AF3FD9F